MLITLVVCTFFLVHIPWWIFLLISISFIALIGIGSAVMRYEFFLKSHNQPENPDHKIALTFDDGPTEYTSDIVNLLDEYDAKGSFFVIGKRVEEMPDQVRRMSEKGHLIGNHSYSHHFFFSMFTKRMVLKELKKTSELIKSVTGKANIFFRPPYGVTNPSIAAAVKKMKMPVIGWNVRSFDTATKNPEKVVEKVISRLVPGSVVLLHDSLPQTLGILEAILLYAKEHNYKCVTVDEIFNIK